MSILYENLDKDVREYMCSELDRDLESGALYIGKRLTDAGATRWPDLLREALRHYDDEWLAGQLRVGGFIRATEERRKPKGGVTTAKVPHTAPETLAEGEFNRFYARGLCAHVLTTGGTEVEVYRGKDVREPRPESQAMVGVRLGAQDLLQDLRTAQGVEPALGLPKGPNSGLSVRRVVG